MNQVESFLEVIKARIVDLDADYRHAKNHYSHRTYFINETSKRLEENKELLLILAENPKKIYH